MVTKNQPSRNGLMESLLALNDKKKDTNPSNLDETNPKKKQLKPKIRYNPP
ncbi:hypothetical protein HpMS32_11910 [Helicobacter pylori]